MHLTKHAKSFLTGKNNEFAFKTIKDRMPIILTKAINELHLALTNLIDVKEEEDKLKEGKIILNALSGLKYDLEHDTVLEPIDSRSEDHGLWNIYLEQMPYGENTWFTAPWLTSECYMYKRINVLFETSTYWKEYDIFETLKKQSYMDSVNSVKLILDNFYTAENFKKFSDNENFKNLFDELIQFSLWGNQSDLSLNVSSEQQNASNKNQKTNSDHLLSHSENLILNDLEKVKNFFKFDELHKETKKGLKVDIILDNAGFELFTDLLFADFLIKSHIASQVTFHVKHFPWFVSDATRNDFEYLLKEIKKIKDESKGNLCNLDWEDNLKSKKWILKYEDGVWNLPHSYWDLENFLTFNNDSECYFIGKCWKEISAESDLVIMKGDLHYRKLTRDYGGHHDIPLEDVLGPLGEKTQHRTPPILCLRTCKSHPQTGLREGQSEELDKIDPDWRINGKFGIVQFYEGLSAETLQ